MGTQSHDIRRLPVWAQENIRSLAEEVLKLKGQIDQLRGAVGASNVFVSGRAMNGDIGLGMNKQIRFQMPTSSSRWKTQRFIDVRHERERHDRDALVIQGDGTILIEAHATNSMRLILERR